MNISTTLRTIARQYPDRPAITEEDATLSYSTFEDRVQRIAGALRQRFGFAAGDRVGLWMENNIEVFPLMYGIWRAGLTAGASTAAHVPAAQRELRARSLSATCGGTKASSSRSACAWA